MIAPVPGVQRKNNNPLSRNKKGDCSSLTRFFPASLCSSQYRCISSLCQRQKESQEQLLADSGKHTAVHCCARPVWRLCSHAAVPAQDPEIKILPGAGIFNSPRCGNHLPVTIVFPQRAGLACNTGRPRPPKINRHENVPGKKRGNKTSAENEKKL